MCVRGDGGSDELIGAKKAGMKTVISVALLQKTKREQRELMASADVHIQQFDQLLELFHTASCGGRKEANASYEMEISAHLEEKQIRQYWVLAFCCACC